MQRERNEVGADTTSARCHEHGEWIGGDRLMQDVDAIFAESEGAIHGATRQAKLRISNDAARESMVIPTIASSTRQAIGRANSGTSNRAP